MDQSISGDILRAKEAIGMVDQVDLSVPIEIPQVPSETEPDNVPAGEHRWLLSEIARLKKERNAYILAHNYAPRDIQDVADAVGDSLYLAQKGAESNAEILLEASVQGMAQFVRDTLHKIVIMATEVGNIYPLSKAALDKTVIPASPEAVCAYMKQNTLRKVYHSLRDGVHEITVDPELADKARVPIERMLSIV